MRAPDWYRDFNAGPNGSRPPPPPKARSQIDDPLLPPKAPGIGSGGPPPGKRNSGPVLPLVPALPPPKTAQLALPEAPALAALPPPPTPPAAIGAVVPITPALPLALTQPTSPGNGGGSLALSIPGGNSGSGGDTAGQQAPSLQSGGGGGGGGRTVQNRQLATVNAAPPPKDMSQKPFMIPGLQSRPFSEDELETAWEMMDLDGHGSLEAQDLRRVLELCGEPTASEAELAMMIRMLDRGATNRVKYQDFWRAFTNPPPLFRNWNLHLSKLETPPMSPTSPGGGDSDSGSSGRPHA
mmetsp:Transcript_28490/g.71580  ORF Transcript_28490/g.71580 Transcript_28490/m.71580 type:complete len:296 (+) Transcript_28490:71-958(+)